MSETLQKAFGIFEGQKVLYRTSYGFVDRIVKDVRNISVREGEEFVGVILQDDDGEIGGYIDFNDIMTLDQLLDRFGLKMIKAKDLFFEKPENAKEVCVLVGLLVKQT